MRRRLGLRGRVMLGFALSALVVSAATAVLSYDLTRRTLLSGREHNAIRAAYYDAVVVHAGLGTDDPNVAEVLRSLDTGGTRQALVWRNGDWYTRNADPGITDAIPRDLQRQVMAGRPAVQRVRTSGGVALVVGVPLSDATQFYVVDSLAELDHELRVLALILTLVAGGTTVAGAVAGAYASRRALRPLAAVADAARDISGGNLRARLEPSSDPDLARLTTSFNQMVDQLARRLERDRRFAADVSHELRSPLQTLANAASVLMHRRDRLDERTAAAAGLIGDEVDRFQRLVADLLELSRIDQPADLAPVDMAEVARQACRAKRLPADLVRCVGEPQPVWHVDERRIRQVLANLLDNAQIHGGGAVAVRLGTDGGGHYLEVDDEGPGVQPEHREAIFDRFVRGRGANARADSEGTGLGLALVAQHVAAHDGRVCVLDRPGGGARFRVELPGRTR